MTSVMTGVNPGFSLNTLTSQALMNRQRTGKSDAVGPRIQPSADSFVRSTASSHSPLLQAHVDHLNSVVPFLRFGMASVARSVEQVKREGKFVKPQHWEFPEKFVEMADDFARKGNMANGADYIVRRSMKNVFNAWLNNQRFKLIADPVTVTLEGKHLGKTVQTQVTSLIGSKQIFAKWLDFINSAQKSVQVALYDFDHLDVDGGRFSAGAEFREGFYLQQQVYPAIVSKAREFKAKGEGVVQLILDASVEDERDDYGHLKPASRKINNEHMVKTLRALAEKEGLPIQVVHYPRELASLFHVKLLVVDSNKAIVGGMNLSNHSAANWDACVAIEGPEAANIQHATFNQDWVVGRYYNENSRFHDRSGVINLVRNVKPGDYQKYLGELPASTPVSHPAIEVLNTIPKEYGYFNLTPREEIGDYLKKTFADPSLKEVLGEQFIMTHPDLIRTLINRMEKNELGFRLLHSQGVVSKFPYTHPGVHWLYSYGGANILRYYNELEEIGEQLHAKLFIMKREPKGAGKPVYDILIGSSNISKAALETNVFAGKERPDGRKNLRGNREVAVVIHSNELAEPFVKQFDIDWKYSESARPDMYDAGQTAAQELAKVGEIEEGDLLDLIHTFRQSKKTS